MKYLSIFMFFIPVLLISCTATKKTTRPPITATTSSPSTPIRSRVILKKDIKPVDINTKNVNPVDLVAFAKLQLGVPYLWGGMDKKKGFDCSGFISYVFSNFNIPVPRVTYQFTNAGVDIPLEFSKQGYYSLHGEQCKQRRGRTHASLLKTGRVSFSLFLPEQQWCSHFRYELLFYSRYVRVTGFSSQVIVHKGNHKIRRGR